MRHCPRIAATGALLALTAICAHAQNIPVDPPVAPFTNVFISIGNAFSNVDALNTRSARPRNLISTGTCRRFRLPCSTA